ncbi:MAG: PEP-CTERM sorting domain-containing protein, partial [Desulfatitalea sp.]
LDWSVSFHGGLSPLGTHSGKAGGFRWWVGDEDMDGTQNWTDAWAHLQGDKSDAQFPGFYWNWNFQNPNSGDYLMLPASFYAAGSFKDIFIGGSFDPVPEPSSMLLLFAAISAIPIMKRKFHLKR